jgi:AmiR/NasT family two-component response regulator
MQHPCQPSPGRSIGIDRARCRSRRLACYGDCPTTLALTRLAPMKLLIVSADEGLAQVAALTLQGQWLRAGGSVLAVVPCHMLVREVVRLAPQLVIAIAERLDTPLRNALALLAASAPRPVVVLSGGPLPDDLAALLDARVMAWLPWGAGAGVDVGAQDVGGAIDPALQPTLALALARFAREQSTELALQAALARFDERKWVDRAKGMLMRGQQLSEEAAFALLRSASMQANLRVGEVSRGVIEAAQAADAVNRAGQLRMLSQRVVKALALRVAAGGRARSDDTLAQTLARIQANLDWLALLPLDGPPAAQRVATVAAWQSLRELAGPAQTGAGRPPAAAVPAPGLALAASFSVAHSASHQRALVDADQRGEALLAHADQLTSALEAASGRRSLQVINLCGRQRMLSQRLAKQALLAGLLPDDQAAAQAAAATLTIREFETTLATLEQAPLATEPIRAALAQARGQWQRLLEGLRRAAGPDAAAGRQQLTRESEALLDSFEQLTSLYEHSMQVLLG